MSDVYFRDKPLEGDSQGSLNVKGLLIFENLEISKRAVPGTRFHNIPRQMDPTLIVGDWSESRQTPNMPQSQILVGFYVHPPGLTVRWANQISIF